MPKITILADLLGSSHVKQLNRYPEFDVFILAGQGENLYRLNRTQRIDHVTYHDFRCRGTGCNANNLYIMQPLAPYFVSIGDQVGGDASFDADLTQAIGVRAVLRADDENNIYQLGQFEQGRLTVLCCIADILRAGPDNVLEAPEQRRNDPLCVIDAEGRLRHICDRRILGQIEPIHILLRLNEEDGAGDLP